MTPVRYLLIAMMILTAAASRLVPHPFNFAPIGAMALFGGATLGHKGLAFFVPLAAMALSDLVIGRDTSWMTVSIYGSFMLIVVLGIWISKRRSFLPIAGATLAGSVLFFLITNFAVWATRGGYQCPLTFDGLIQCYIYGIPFFGNTLMGDAFYSAVLFGGFALYERVIPELREHQNVQSIPA